MTVLLTPTPNPFNPKEQDTLVEAVAVLTPGETLSILPGIWPGVVIFPPSVNVVGVNRETVILPGRHTFPGGGNLINLTFPEKSFISYGNGGGIFRSLIMDGDIEFTGEGLITGTDILSLTKTGTVTISPNAGVSLNLTNVTFGPLALAGASNLINSSASQLTTVGGTSTLNNVIIQDSLICQPGAATFIQKNVVIG